MSIAEQIKDLENTRAALVGQMDTLGQKSIDSGESMSPEDGEAFDDLSEQIKQIDTDLARFRNLEKLQGQAAQPVAGHDQKSGSQSRAGQYQVRTKSRPDSGIEFAQYAICLAAAKGHPMQAHEIAKSRYADSDRVVSATKAAVSAGSTDGWGSELADQGSFVDDFVEYLRPQTIIGQINGFRRVPFGVRINAMTEGAGAGWVGEGAATPVTRQQFGQIQMEQNRIGAIVTLSKDLLKASRQDAERLVRDDLARSIIGEMDRSFVDPDFAGEANVSPAAVTHGVDPIRSAGSTPAKVRADIKSLWQQFIRANNSATNAVYVMSGVTALEMSLMTEQSGARSFPEIGPAGGTIRGTPVITSEHVPTVTNAGTDGTNGSYIALVSPDDIYLADDGQVALSMSDQASIDMQTNPTGSSTAPTGTSTVSMFQTNSIALLAERYLDWRKRRPSAVALVNGVNYGQ